MDQEENNLLIKDIVENHPSIISYKWKINGFQNLMRQHEHRDHQLHSLSFFGVN